MFGICKAPDGRVMSEIQKIKSEGHKSKSESNISFLVGFSIGLISVWKLPSRKSNLKVVPIKPAEAD